MLLELTNVTKRFGAVVAVDDLSFFIPDGEVLGVMGPNGSGKTTLLNLIMGVYPLEKGSIQFDGKEISGLPTNEISCMGIGRTYQIPQPFHGMTVLENLMVGDLYGARHKSMHTARDNALAILDRVGLTEKAEWESGKCGLLDLKRLELARALSLRPKLLLLDEIAAGLTPGEIADLQKLLLDIKEENQTMLIIEHVLNVMFDLSDRILVLNFGEQIAEGTPEEVAENPRVHRIYLGSKNEGKTAESKTDTDARPPEVEPNRLLSLQNVNAGYGDFQALFDVSLDIIEGDITALIGVNGAGKSTLIRAIYKQVPIAGGDIHYKGKSIVGLKPYDIIGLGIAQCIEGRKLFPDLTVHENLEIGAYCKRARAQRQSTIDRIFNLFPILANRQNQVASTLSGGEQQMLAIGRALMALPDLIIFDEVSLGLAPIIIDNLYDAIMEINRQGTTILLVEQNVHRSLAVADRAYIIERGRITLSGTAEALRRNDYVKEAYFGL
ncbi:MAG: ATP-binding cassette domain-containing protein [Deltaproteobacteria bacterium]|nr:ATP-binding cassette domain-containing protein [Deltaproteobacteria bacterium]